MMEPGAYFLVSPPSSGLASPCAANANMTLNAISPLEMGTDLDFSSTAVAAIASTTDQSANFSPTGGGSRSVTYNASSTSPFDDDDPLDLFADPRQLLARPQLQHHNQHHQSASTPIKTHTNHYSHLLHSADFYAAEHLVCQSAPLERGCDSPLISMQHPFVELAGVCGVDDCDDLIDHSASFQSQDSLAFMRAMGGSLSSGSSDCSLSMGANGSSSVYDGPDDMITSNSIDFYSNYYNFNDCLQSDMLMTSQPTQQQQYTTTTTTTECGASSNSAASSEAGKMGATGTNESTATITTSKEKRSVLMNLLLDGSDIGAGYTSINCRSLQSRTSDQQQLLLQQHQHQHQHQQQRCPLFKHGLVWGNHS